MTRKLRLSCVPQSVNAGDVSAGLPPAPVAAVDIDIALLGGSPRSIRLALLGICFFL